MESVKHNQDEIRQLDMRVSVIIDFFCIFLRIIILDFGYFLCRTETLDLTKKKLIFTFSPNITLKHPYGGSGAHLLINQAKSVYSVNDGAFQLARLAHGHECPAD